MARSVTHLADYNQHRLVAKEAHACESGRIVLRRKGDYRELRFEVRAGEDATGQPIWRRATETQQHRILMSYAKTKLLGGSYGH